MASQANSARQRMQSPAQKVLKDLLANPALLAGFAVAVGATAAAMGVVATGTANDAKNEVAAISGDVPPVVQAQLDALSSALSTTTAEPAPTTQQRTTTTTEGPTEAGTTTTLSPEIVALPGRVDSVNADLSGIRVDLASLDTSQEGLTGSQSKLADLADRTAAAAVELAGITDDLNTQLVATGSVAADALRAGREADGKAVTAAEAAATAQASADEALTAAGIGRNYSNTEEATGSVWQEKPVYRRTFHADTATGFTTLISSDLTSTDIDDILSLTGTGVTSFNGAWMQFPFYNGTYQVYPYITAAGVHVYAFNTALSDITITVTYTRP